MKPSVNNSLSRLPICSSFSATDLSLRLREYPLLHLCCDVTNEYLVMRNMIMMAWWRGVDCNEKYDDDGQFAGFRPHAPTSLTQ